LYCIFIFYYYQTSLAERSHLLHENEKIKTHIKLGISDVGLNRSSCVIWHCCGPSCAANSTYDAFSHIR